jgi:hypothetical protein
MDDLRERLEGLIVDALGGRTEYGAQQSAKGIISVIEPEIAATRTAAFNEARAQVKAALMAEMYDDSGKAKLVSWSTTCALLRTIEKMEPDK